MKVALIHHASKTGVINNFGMQNKENYKPATIEKVAKALEKGGHHVRIMEGDMYIAERLSAFMPKNINKNRPGLVFNMAYGIQGLSRYTHIPAMLEMLGVPYVGSGPAGHALALDKVITKVLFQRNNLPTPQYWVLSGPEEVSDDIVYPAIVKPKMESVSFGIRVVYEEQALKEAVEYIVQEYQQQALVEEFIPGREFAVGLLGNNSYLETFPVLEIDFKGDIHAIQTLDDKRSLSYGKLCPAPIPENLALEMQELARRAFNSLGLNDFARVDLRLDQNNNIYLLELNSMASLSETGSYVTAARAVGYTFDSLVNKMLESTSIRYFGSEMQCLTASHKNKRVLPLSARIQGYLRNKAYSMEDSLKQLVRINTHVRNIEGVNSCGRVVGTKLNLLGFETRVYPQVEVGDIMHFSNCSFTGSDVLLLCHLDIPYDIAHHGAYMEKGNYLLGPGIAENKGGVVVMLYALQALRYARSLKNLRCEVLITTDDSLQGKYSREIIKSLSQTSRIVLGLKHGGKNDTIVNGRCGSGYYTLEVQGVKPQNILPGQSKEIQILCNKILSLAKLSDPQQGIYVDPVSLEAGNSFGAAAYSCKGAIRLRFKDTEVAGEIDGKIRQIANKNNNEYVNIQLSGKVNRMPTVENEGSAYLMDIARCMAQKLDMGIQEEYRWSSSDICHVPTGIGILDGLGPVGGDCRSPHEYILRTSLIERAALLALIINEYSSRQRCNSGRESDYQDMKLAVTR